MVTPFAPAVAPSGLAAVAGRGSVALTWNAVSGAYWYYVSRSTVSGGPYTTIGYSTSNKYTDTGVTKGVKYYYVVSVYINISGFGSQSPNSAAVNATPS